MKKIITLLLIGATCLTQAQTPAGTAFRIDYDEFEDGNGIKYLDCGDDDMLNAGDEMTMMLWAQFRDFNDNQKICGKFNLDNSGFVMGVNQGRIYCEAWNPTFYEGLDGLMNPTAEFWYHLTMTFEAGDAMRTYINGVEVGVHDVSANGLTTSDNPFIIGVSPWADFNSFQSFGNLDEMGYYNVALSPEEIRAQMFKSLVGDESGLIAAWDFDGDSGVTAADISGNGNEGQAVGNFTGSEWIESTAVIADSNTESAQELTAIWNGLTFTDPRFTSSTHGMNLLANELTNVDFVVFGHDGGSGITDADIPTNASPSFMRSVRTWSVTDQSVTAMTVIMNLAQAAGGGMELDGSYPAENYTLLYRPFGESTFSAAANGATFNSGVTTFTDIMLQSGEYAIGVGNGVVESIEDHPVGSSFAVYPNPTSGEFVVQFDENVNGLMDFLITDITGRQIDLRATDTSTNSSNYSVDLSNEPAGVYLISIKVAGVWHNQRITKR